MWVSPFRHLRITGYVLLPAAFRSLSRLSSALSAKASTLRSYWLDLLDGMYSVTYLHGFGSLSQLTLLRPSSNKNSCVSLSVNLFCNNLPDVQPALQASLLAVCPSSAIITQITTSDVLFHLEN